MRGQHGVHFRGLSSAGVSSRGVVMGVGKTKLESSQQRRMLAVSAASAVSGMFAIHLGIAISGLGYWFFAGVGKLKQLFTMLSTMWIIVLVDLNSAFCGS